MQAVIMAAGRGSRLATALDGRPKPMAEVQGRFLIDWILEAFDAYNIKPVTIVVGHKFEQLQYHLSNREIDFIFNPFYSYGQVLSSFWFAIDSIDSSKDLIFCHGDTIFDPIVLDKLIRTKGDVVLPFDGHQCDSEAMKIRLDKQGHIVKLTKEMNPPDADGEFIGLALIRSSFVPTLLTISQSIITQGGLNAYFEEALQVSSDQGLVKLKGLDISGVQWREIDFPEDLEIARSFKWSSTRVT